MSTFPRGFALAVVSSVVAACGGGGGSGGSGGGGTLPDGSQLPNSTDTIGFVEVMEEVLETDNGPTSDVDIEIGFGHLSSPDGLHRMREQFLRPIDTCKVNSIGNDVTRLDGPVFNLDLDYVPAGEVITVRSDSGSLAEFHPSTIFDTIFGYSIQATSGTGGDIAGPAPSGMVVDLPGAVFPAMSIPVPEVTSFRAINPAAGDQLRLEEPVRWQAGNNPNATIMLRATGFSLAGEGSLVSLECTMADDGEFVIPADTRRAFGDAIITFTPAFGRRVLSVERQNGATVVVENFSGIKSGSTF